jgi:DNA (cytosine-5)-methyltransferase 1
MLTAHGGRLDFKSETFVLHKQAFRTTGNSGVYDAGDLSPCLTTGSDQNAIVVMDAGRVRRLMPVEWEILQGFPRGYTDVMHRGKPAADGPRCKAIGNSMAVPVMRYIGERIDAVK